MFNSSVSRERALIFVVTGFHDINTLTLTVYNCKHGVRKKCTFGLGVLVGAGSNIPQTSQSPFFGL